MVAAEIMTEDVTVTGIAAATEIMTGIVAATGIMTEDVTVTEIATVTETGIATETVTGTEIEIVTVIWHRHGSETITVAEKLVAAKISRLKNRYIKVPVLLRKSIFLI